MAPIIAYAARTGTRRNLEALRARGWRLLVSATGVHRTEGFDNIAIDNGAWTAYQNFLKGRASTPLLDKRLFIKVVLLLGSVSDWAVACDIVSGGDQSLALSLRWIPWVLKHCKRALLAVQDGMTVEQIRPHLGPDVGIFVGGGRCVQGVHGQRLGRARARVRNDLPRRSRELAAPHPPMRSSWCDQLRRLGCEPLRARDPGDPSRRGPAVLTRR